MRLATREVTTLGIFIALAVAAGYALLQVPNLELITSITFLAGLSLGIGKGTMVGAVSMFLFSLFNPMGVPFPPVLMAQILFMGLTGFVGGMWRRWIRAHAFKPLFVVGLAVTGFFLTLLYDVGTNAGFALSAGLISQLPKIVAAGVVFSLIHMLTNTLLFAIFIPTAVKVLNIEKRKPAKNEQ